MLKKLTFIGLATLGFVGNSGFAKPLPPAKKPPQSKSIYIKLKLDDADPIKVNAAPLKYNKHLAFSFTLDDGYRSAYVAAFPLLNGGHVTASLPDEWRNDEGGDGNESKGLFYSDGCGNNVPFKLGLAINAANIGDLPLNRGHLSWPEVQEMYDAGWDILNHGFHHATKHGTDFYAEVVKNVKMVKDSINFNMSQFIVPGGESDKGYEHDYEKDALKTGSFAVASYKGAGPVIAVDQPVNLTNMIYARDFIRSNKDSINMPMIDKHIQTIDSLMQQPQTLWFHQFTHGVGNTNLWNLSVLFPEFKYYMTSIEKKYGTTGTDKIWMAPWQEVYEYMWLRDHLKITTQQNGRNVVIKIEVPEIPETFRYEAISLNVKTTSKFTVSSGSSKFKVTNNGETDHNLVNINLK